MAEKSQRVPRHGFLTEAQVDDLPAEIQGHYREHTWLRHPADLVHFPEPVRSSLQHLVERSRRNLLKNIAHEEGRRAS